MSVKTWFHFIPIIIFFTIVPVIAIVLPTVEIQGDYWGGGPIRQYLVNSCVHLLKPVHASTLVKAFMEASLSMEVIMTLPIVLNVTWFMLLTIYILGTIFIELNNLISRGIYSSQRQRAKGA